jgi:NAD(P)H-dependent nitrite reductase small subunit
VTAWVKVAKASDFSEGQGKTVIANEKEIALFMHKGKFCALDNTCPHRGGPLGEGHLENGEVVCPWHAWAFEVTTGKCRVLPGEVDAKTYPVKVEGEDVLVDA